MTALAIAVRARVAALALIRNGRVATIERRHFEFTPTDMSRVAFLAERIARLARIHDVTTIVVEPGSLAEAAVEAGALTAHTITIADVKVILMGPRETPSHAELYDHLVKMNPELARYVRILQTGRVASCDAERFRTVNLLAAALALAYERGAWPNTSTTTAALTHSILTYA